MYSRIALFAVIILCLLIRQGELMQHKEAMAKKEIQIRRLANKICSPVTDLQVKIDCVERRIIWSKPL